MLITTHRKIANKLYDELGKKFQRYVSRHAFIEGNSKPDFDPKYAVNHYYEKTFHFVSELIEEIRNNRFSRKVLGKKLGIISHFIVDYSITYHSHEKYKEYNTLKHFQYELRIDNLFKNSTIYKEEFNESIFTDIDHVSDSIENYIESMQCRKAKPREDLINALLNTYNFLNLLIEEYAKDERSPDRSKMRVAIFTDTYFPHINGVSNTIHQMIQYFERKNIPYILLTPKYKKKDARRQGINIESVKSIKFFLSPETRLALPSKKRLTTDLDEFNPTIIQVMTEFNMGYFGLRYGLKNEIPVFTNFSTDFPKYLSYYRMKLLIKPLWKYLRWFHSKGVKTFTPSYETVRYLNRNNINNVSVFSRGIDTSLYSEENRSQQLIDEWGTENKFTFLFVGRLSEEKDLSVLCKAYNLLHEKYGELVQLVIVGDGPERKRYEKLLPEDVIFTGYLKGEELAKAYASCDVFSFPSSSETFGNVVLEAMASSLPVIGVNKGGVIDSIQQGYNGVLVEEGNHNEFFLAMEDLLLHPKKVKTLSENALSFSKTRSWSFVFHKLESYYETAVED